MSNETRVLLVRHGQSEWNATGRWQGQADPPLTELGRLQAREAARGVGAVDAIWASDLQRAADTATIIADDIGVGPVVVDPDLRERHAGEWSGLTRDEIEQRFPSYLATDRRPPGWEPDERLLARARRALARIADAVPGGDVLVVTHAGLIYAIERWLGAEFERIANGAGRWVTVTGTARGDGDGPATDGVTLRLGERLLLTDPADTTVPGQI